MQAERVVFNVGPGYKWGSLILTTFFALCAAGLMAGLIAMMTHLYEPYLSLALCLPFMILTALAAVFEARLMWFRDRVELDEDRITYVKRRLGGERRMVLRWEELTRIRHITRPFRDPEARVELYGSDARRPVSVVYFTWFAGADQLVETIAKLWRARVPEAAQGVKIPNTFRCTLRPFCLRVALVMVLFGPALIGMCLVSSGQQLAVSLALTAIAFAGLAYGACMQRDEMSVNEDSIVFTKWCGVREAHHFSELARLQPRPTPFGPYRVDLVPAKGRPIHVDENCLEDPAEPCRTLIAAWEAWRDRSAKSAASGMTVRPGLDGPPSAG